MKLAFSSSSRARLLLLGVSASLLGACVGSDGEDSSSSSSMSSSFSNSSSIITNSSSSSSASSMSSSSASSSSVSNEPLAANLLSSDGGFSNGQGAFSTYMFVDDATVLWNDEVSLSLDTASTEAWHVQLIHEVSLVEGEEYTLCYDAKAEGIRDMNTNIDSGDPDYSSVMGMAIDVDLSTGYESFSHTFIANETNAAARVTFGVGLSDLSVQLDNIGVYPGSMCGSASEFEFNPNSVPEYVDVPTEPSYDDISNYPFPHNAGYVAGVTSPMVSPNELKLDYENWKAGFIEYCGPDEARLVYPQFAEGTSGPKRHTNSEGIGYAMLIAAYMGDLDLFDSLYKFYLRYAQASGVFMHWRILSCDGPVLTGAASDGDLDVAFALIVGQQQWDSEYYGSEAGRLIRAFRDIFFIDCNGRKTLKPGDAFGTCSCVNPSYYSPAYYRIFAEYDSGNRQFWEQARNDAYTHLMDGQHPETGLVRAWADAWGNSASNCLNQSSGGGAADDYQFDALRTPWRVGMDWAWSGDQRAKNFLDKLLEFVNDQPVEHVTPSYYHDGTPFAWDRDNPFPKGEPDADGARSTPMVGGFTSAQLAGSQAKIDEFAAAWQSIYKRHDWNNPGDGWAYNASLSLLYGLLVSGNFWDPLNPMASVPYNPNGANISGNVIVNGDFSDYLHRWLAGSWANNQGHLIVENGELRFAIKEVVPGQEVSLAAQQLYIPVEGSMSYELSFDARAAGARDILVDINAGSSLSQKLFSLSTTNDTYTLTVTIPEVVRQVNLVIMVGQSTEDVWFDNFVLKPL